MLRRILVPLDKSEATSVATRMAALIAQRETEDAQHTVILTGLGVVDLDHIPSGRFASVVDREKIIQSARETRDEIAAAFHKEATDVGMAPDKVESLSVDGSPFREIIRESVFSDLIVMGEKCSFPPLSQDYETLNNLYHEASRPILLTHTSAEPVKTVIMAMDGTAPASRMMYQYVHLNPFPQAKVVLSYSRNEEIQYNLTEFFAKVEKFLTSYGFQVKSNPIEGSLSEGIARAVVEEEAQVVALGIHREHFMDRLSDPLGIRQNFTTRLVRNQPASLFLVH